jgi:hypothetical protein
MNSRNEDVSSRETECALMYEICEYAGAEHEHRLADEAQIDCLECELSRLRGIEAAARAVFEGRLHPGEWRNPEVPGLLMEALGKALAVPRLPVTDP